MILVRNFIIGVVLISSAEAYAQEDMVNAGVFGMIENDSLTDSHPKLSAAILEAERRGLRKVQIPAGIYYISRGFLLPDSMTITGSGMGKTIIRLMNNLPARSDEATQTAVFTGKHAYSLSHHSPTRKITIRSLSIDLRKPAGLYDITRFPMLGGIRFINALNCLVDSVEVLLPQKFGIGLYAGKSGIHCTSNTVKNCRIQMEENWYLQMSPEPIPRSAESCIGIELASFSGQENNGAAVSLSRRNAYYQPSKTRMNIIQSNQVSGGSHGISVSNASRNQLLRNTVSGCSNRGIIIITTSDSNTVSGNNVMHSGSTGIHLAYNCNYNIIKNNIVTGVLGVEGDGIKSYINCNYNRITGNQVSGFATTGIRISHGANYNIISKNTVTGTDQPGQTGIKIIANNRRQYDDGFRFNNKLTASSNICVLNNISHVDRGVLLDDDLQLKNSTRKNQTGNNKFSRVKERVAGRLSKH